MHRFAVRVLGLMLVLSPAPAFAQDLEAVIEWNRILQTTVASTATPTVFFTRPYAMTSVAVFDALNSIDHAYHPYIIELDAPRSASRAAAAAQAAHDVLVALYPGQRATLDAALAATLSRLPAAAAAEGVLVGTAAAQACLDQRAGDRWDALPTEYMLPNLPGYYQLTPPQNGVVTFTHYPDVQPFIIGNRLQFLAGPPPSLTSDRYTADFNEVKALGAVNSTTRTAEQTSIALRWAGAGTSTPFPQVWNAVARDVALRANFSALDMARAFALLNMAGHDALFTSFTGKFLYGLWRPVTAIRDADRDNNPDTAADPAWLSLLGTPPYPSYPGNMSCIAAASARTLERVFGRNDIPFVVTWTGAGTNPNIVRNFNGFRELADEQEASRVYGGIHFRFDHTASFGVCTPLADYAVDNYLRRR